MTRFNGKAILSSRALWALVLTGAFLACSEEKKERKDDGGQSEQKSGTVDAVSGDANPSTDKVTGGTSNDTGSNSPTTTEGKTGGEAVAKQPVENSIVPFNAVDGLETITAATLTSEDPVSVYATTVHPLVKEYCGSCHGVDQSPKFAVNDPNEAFAAVQTAKLINTKKTNSSRFYQRLASLNHSCWGDCADNATEMLQLLDSFASRTSDISGVVNGVVTTSSLTFVDAAQAAADDTPAAIPGLVTVEAESATLTGAMIVLDSAGASGAKAIYTMNGQDPANQQDANLSMDTAVFNVEVKDAGMYYLFGNTAAVDGNDDSFHVSVNDGGFVRWNTTVTNDMNTFAWNRANNNGADFGPFQLAAGTHKIEIRRREDGAVLDALALSTDPNFTGVAQVTPPDPGMVLTFNLDDPNAAPELRPCPGTGATMTVEVQDFNTETWRFRNPTITASADAGVDYKGLHIIVNDIENSQYATFELVEGTVPAGQSMSLSGGAMLVLKENGETDTFQFRFDACGPEGSLATQ